MWRQQRLDDGDLQHKLVFSNHSVLQWTTAPYFHVSIQQVYRAEIKEILLNTSKMKIFLICKGENSRDDDCAP